MNDSRPEDVLYVCLGCIDGISDAMLLRDDAPTLDDLWALIPRGAWDLKTRGTLAIRIEPRTTPGWAGSTSIIRSAALSARCAAPITSPPRFNDNQSEPRFS